MANKDKISCIRVLADINQINDCQEILEEAEAPISDIANILSLAGNKVRLKILYLFSKEDKLCVCDLSDILDMNVAAVSQHLRKLKDGQILASNKIGQTIFYSLRKEKLHILRPLFKQIEKNRIKL